MLLQITSIIEVNYPEYNPADPNPCDTSVLQNHLCNIINDSLETPSAHDHPHADLLPTKLTLQTLSIEPYELVIPTGYTLTKI